MENIVRDELVEWIAKPENEDLLETLKLMKEASINGDWYDQLNEEEKASIEQGLDDHEKGKTLSSNEFWNKNA